MFVSKQKIPNWWWYMKKTIYDLCDTNVSIMDMVSINQKQCHTSMRHGINDVIKAALE